MATILFLIRFSTDNKVNSLHDVFYGLSVDNNQMQGILLTFLCQGWIFMIPAAVVELKSFKW